MGISTHILDITRGRPAADVDVTLEFEEAPARWVVAGGGRTNADGRVKPLEKEGTSLRAGTYRVNFAVKAYLDEHHKGGFYPSVSITFSVVNPAEHFHVPLLLSPYGFSTYRGS